MADQNYSPHFLFRFGGAYGSETWSCGLRIRITPYGDETGTILDEVSMAFLDAVSAPFRTFADALKTFTGQGISWDTISMNHISRSGKYTRPNSHARVLTPAVAGTATSAWHGPDSAVAVTLLTGQQRGYASKGRIYLPIGGVSIITTAGPEWGAISANQRSAIANATATFLSAINNLGTEMATANPSVLGASCAVGVFSPGTGSKQSSAVPGEYRTVTAVRVGGQLDVQQRRLNKVDDLWLSTSASVTVAP